MSLFARQAKAQKPNGSLDAIKREKLAQKPAKVGRLMGLFLTLVLLFLMGRVVQLQTHPDERVAKRVNSQVSSRALIGRRGAIYDRRGRMLASTRVDYRVFLDTKLAVDIDRFAEQVAYVAGYSPHFVKAKIERYKRSPRYVVLEERVRPERLAAIKAAKITGVGIEPIVVREYPYDTLAGELVGFTNIDGQGIEGAEFVYNAQLDAEKGKIEYLRDASSRALFVQSDQYQPQQDGEHVRLSIDATLQHICETHLRVAVEKFQAAKGEVVLMDPYTGEVLAMANAKRGFAPFSPANYRNTKPKERRNSCVTDIFEPGSIFKPFVWAGLTQMGMAKPQDTIDTEDGAWRTNFRRTLRDDYGYDELSWEYVLVKSSNIGMAKISQKIGYEDLRDIVLDFGFGQKTGVGLAGEENGLAPRPAKARHPRQLPHSQISIPMGQEIAVTPLQLVRGFSAIANGGMLITPTVMALDPTAPTPGLMRRRILREDIAKTTREALRKVISPVGTGRDVAKDNPHYSIFGKTGTAQLPRPAQKATATQPAQKAGYYQDRYVASFIAGAPLDNPRLAIVVVVHDPKRSLGLGWHGGQVSAPAACQILEESLLYLGVEPDVKPFEKTPSFFVVTGDASDSDTED